MLDFRDELVELLEKHEYGKYFGTTEEVLADFLSDQLRVIFMTLKDHNSSSREILFRNKIREVEDRIKLEEMIKSWNPTFRSE